jgi:peptidoglycan/xylan/chitin deacetylase (PgdA/CDA1 family)
MTKYVCELNMINFIRKTFHYFEKKIMIRKPEKYYYLGHQRPMISFAFDDFPLSAGVTGAGIINNYNLKATFFISLGKLGQNSAVGKICEVDTLKNLISQNHEIGSHTYDHTNRFEVSIDDYEKSIIKNQQCFEELFPGGRLETFSYPFGIAGNRAQMIVQKHFRCARTSNIGVNFGKVDVNMLKAFPVYGSGEEIELLKSAIQFTIIERGWLIFYTHDVRENPSLYGCTPKYLEEVVRLSVESGAKIVTIKEACNILSVPLNGN